MWRCALGGLADESLTATGAEVLNRGKLLSFEAPVSLVRMFGRVMAGVSALGWLRCCGQESAHSCRCWALEAAGSDAGAACVAADKNTANI